MVRLISISHTLSPNSSNLPWKSHSTGGRKRINPLTRHDAPSQGRGREDGTGWDELCSPFTFFFRRFTSVNNNGEFHRMSELTSSLHGYYYPRVWSAFCGRDSTDGRWTERGRKKSNDCFLEFFQWRVNLDGTRKGTDRFIEKWEDVLGFNSVNPLRTLWWWWWWVDDSRWGGQIMSHFLSPCRWRWWTESKVLIKTINWGS